jgi:hypothetical protein
MFHFFPLIFIVLSLFQTIFAQHPVFVNYWGSRRPLHEQSSRSLPLSLKNSLQNIISPISPTSAPCSLLPYTGAHGLSRRDGIAPSIPFRRDGASRTHFVGTRPENGLQLIYRDTLRKPADSKQLSAVNPWQTRYSILDDRLSIIDTDSCLLSIIHCLYSAPMPDTCLIHKK